MDARDARAVARALGLPPPRRAPAAGYDADWADLFGAPDDAEAGLGAVAAAVAALPKFSGALGRWPVSASFSAPFSTKRF